MNIRWAVLGLACLCAMNSSCRRGETDRAALAWDTHMGTEPPRWVADLQALGMTLRSGDVLTKADEVYRAALWIVPCDADTPVEDRVLDVLADYVRAGGKLLCVVRDAPAVAGEGAGESWWVNRLGTRLGFKVLSSTTRKPRNLAPELLGYLDEVRRTTWAAYEIRLIGPGTVLVADDDLRALAVLREVGKGRVVVVGHQGLLEENPALARNMVLWLAGAD